MYQFLIYLPFHIQEEKIKFFLQSKLRVITKTRLPGNGKPAILMLGKDDHDRTHDLWYYM